MSLFSPEGRSTIETATRIAVLLGFFFALGLAGGAYYRNGHPAENAAETAEADSPPTGPAKLAPSLAQVAPTAPEAGPTPFPDEDRAPAPVAMAPSPPPAAAPPPVPAAALEAPAPAQQASPAPAASAPRPRRAVAHSRSSRARAVAQARAAPGSPMQIQFGAFANEANARRVQWAIEATGMQVEVTHLPNAGGRALYTPRSLSFPDAAAAREAAAAVRDKVQHLVNAVPIEYAIVSSQPPPQQQAALAQH